jgi:hypothetical protein
MKDRPTNKTEYWKFVNEYFDALENIIKRFAPDKLEEAQLYKKEQNPQIARIFELCWENAPDEPNIHFIRAWNILCNLCSESYVLDE